MHLYHINTPLPYIYPTHLLPYTLLILHLMLYTTPHTSHTLHVDHGGTIDRDELSAILTRLGYPIDNDRIDDIFTQFDHDEEGDDYSYMCASSVYIVVCLYLHVILMCVFMVVYL